MIVHFVVYRQLLSGCRIRRLELLECQGDYHQRARSTRLKDSTREAYDTRPRFGLNIDSRSFSDSDSGISGSVETNRSLPSVSLGNQARDSEVVVLRPEE